MSEEQQEPKQALVLFNQNGLVEFKDHSELAKAASLLISLKVAPDHFKGDQKAVMAAMTFCRQYNLPYSALNELAWIKGKIGAFGSLYTALAQRHPQYGDMVVLYTDEQMNVISLENKNLNADVWSCVIRIKKKGDELWKEYFFTKDEAKTAGLLSNNTYQKYLKTMLYHRAKVRAFSTEYASALNGVESAEILMQEQEIKDVSPLNALNERLGLKDVGHDIETESTGLS